MHKCCFCAVKLIIIGSDQFFLRPKWCPVLCIHQEELETKCPVNKPRLQFSDHSTIGSTRLLDGPVLATVLASPSDRSIRALQDISMTFTLARSLVVTMQFSWWMVESWRSEDQVHTQSDCDYNCLRWPTGSRTCPQYHTWPCTLTLLTAF